MFVLHLQIIIGYWNALQAIKRLDYFEPLRVYEPVEGKCVRVVR